MTPRHDATGRIDEPPGPAAALEGSVESTSTRVLLDGNTRQCGVCDASISAGSRYRCVTVRTDDGAVSEVCFCDDDCVDSVPTLDG